MTLVSTFHLAQTKSHWYKYDPKILPLGTLEFKQEAVRLAETSDKSTVQIEKDSGISQGMLNKWKGKLSQEGQDSFRGHRRLSRSEAGVERLHQENELLCQE